MVLAYVTELLSKNGSDELSRAGSSVSTSVFLAHHEKIRMSLGQIVCRVMRSVGYGDLGH